MKHNILYSRIKALLDEHRVRSDRDAIWKGVQRKMKKKKRRKMVLFSFLLIGSLSFAFWSYMILSQDTVPYSQNEIQPLKSVVLDVQKAQNFIPKTKKEILEAPSIQELSQEPSLVQIRESNVEKKAGVPTNITQLEVPGRNDKELVHKSVENGMQIEELPMVLAPVTTSIRPVSSLNIRVLPRMPFSLNTVPQTGIDLLSDGGTWSVGLYFSPGMISSNFKATQSRYNVLAQVRTEAEKPVRALSFGADIRYKLSNHWFISSGLEYNRYIDKFESSYESVSKEIDPDGIVRYEVQTRGSIEAIRGSVEVTRIQNVYRKTYNRYHLLSVPLILGYIQDDHSLTWGGHLGVQAQSLLKVSGAAFGLDNSVKDLSNYSLDDQTLYSSQLQMNALVGIELGYSIFPHWNVYASPEIIKGLGSLSGNDVGIEQQVDRYRIRFGLRRTF